MRELLARVGADELTHWQAYDRVEGLPDRRATAEAASIAHTVWAMLKGKGGREMTVSDFAVTFGASEPQGPDRMRAALMAVTANAGGEFQG